MPQQKSKKKSTKKEGKKNSGIPFLAQRRDSFNISETKSIASQDDIDEIDSEYNKESLAYIMTKKYSKLIERSSILDGASENSMLSRSKFRGLHNFTMVAAIICLIVAPLLKYKKYGYLINVNLLESMEKDFWLCVSTWPLFYLWSYNAYFLQKFIMKGMNKKLAAIYQHSTQFLMFIYCMYIINEKNWPTSHAGFVTMLACTHFMKMHSYTMINQDYRQDYLDCQKSIYKPLSSYPKHITLWNFTLYMWMPILVYQEEFPRTKKFRLGYFINKTFQTFAGILISYLILSDYIIPFIEQGEKISAFALFCNIILPMWIFTMVVFYTVWECMCNAFAELTLFGDRQFYMDWWNSTTYEEFNRKWNRCVYNFLFRHIYLECAYRFKFSKGMSQFLTFLFSALLHEWILVLAFRIVRPIITICMMQQIPLFYATKWLYKSRAGNLFMWFGLLGGVPFIGITYLRSHPEVTQHYSNFTI